MQRRTGRIITIDEFLNNSEDLSEGVENLTLTSGGSVEGRSRRHLSYADAWQDDEVQYRV